MAIKMEQPPFKDLKLNKIINEFYIIEKTCNQSMKRLSEKTKLKFTCKDDDIGSYIFNCRIKNKKIFTLMNSISSIRNFSWNKLHDAYQLDDSLNEYDRVFVPKNDFIKSRNNLSLPIMDTIDNLSDKELSNLENNGIPAMQLPTSVQKNILRIIDSINKEDKYKDGIQIENNLRDIKFQITKNPSPGFRSYMFYIKTPSGVFGTGVDDYEDWKQKLINNSGSTHYENKTKQIKREKWDDTDIGRKKVSYSGYASPVEIFTEIAANFDFDFLCDRKKFWKQSKRVQYNNITIANFLQEIEKDFPNTKCDISSDEVAIIQAPLNPWRIYSSRKRS
jgi:hypothetical protein